MKPLKHQVKAARKLKKKLSKYKLALLAGLPRSGKTISFLLAAKDYDNVLIITQKSAIKDIESQAEAIGADNIIVTNFHQVHKFPPLYDLIIVDEAHRWIAAATPKPSRIWKDIKRLMHKDCDLILSSGTPSPESYAQLYHPFQLSPYSPWKEYSRFTEWFNDGYGVPYTIRINNIDIKQYNKTNYNKIWEDIKPYVVSMTREEAGHKYEATDKLIHLSQTKEQKKYYKKLDKDRVIPKLNVLADTPSKLNQKKHQISGGFVFDEDGSTIHLKSNPKLDWLKENIDPEKTIILANYIPEQELLAKHFPHTGSITKNAEGKDFSHFDKMVIYSMSFSAATYEQVRARQMNINRKTPIEIIYLISGIDNDVYAAVSNKKNFTASYYRRKHNA